jgi:hypothetical protein
MEICVEACIVEKEEAHSLDEEYVDIIVEN